MMILSKAQGMVTFYSVQLKCLYVFYYIIKKKKLRMAVNFWVIIYMLHYIRIFHFSEPIHDEQQSLTLKIYTHT